jgi:hypothetical protein
MHLSLTNSFKPLDNLDPATMHAITLLSKVSSRLSKLAKRTHSEL